MRFKRHERFVFQDTPRKRAAFLAKQRREQQAVPLFAEQVAESQQQAPGVDEVMKARAEAFAQGDKQYRRERAAKWRWARAKISAHPQASTIRRFWNDAPYPAEPSYLLSMIHDIERGRIALDRNPPWRPTPAEIAKGRELIANYEKQKARKAKSPRDAGSAPSGT